MAIFAVDLPLRNVADLSCAYPSSHKNQPRLGLIPVAEWYTPILAHATLHGETIACPHPSQYIQATQTGFQSRHFRFSLVTYRKRLASYPQLRPNFHSLENNLGQKLI